MRHFPQCSSPCPPPIGELEVSDDSVTWRRVPTLHSIYRYHSLRPETISFPAATGRYFRLHLHDWTPQAGFVVACGEATEHSGEDGSVLPIYNPWKEETVSKVDGRWTLTFDRTLGGPTEAVAMEELTDWTSADNPAVRYFSGLCSYDNTFRLKKAPEGRLMLRIPRLKGIARVLVNGREAGLVWCLPWETDITSLVKKGRNTLRIEVRNSLLNRLVGDVALPEAERKMWIFKQIYGPETNLQPSGIVGDVLLISK